MMGGLANEVKARLQKQNVYQNFIDIINQEWSRVFTNIKGLYVGFATPSKHFSHSRKDDFVTC